MNKYILISIFLIIPFSVFSQSFSDQTLIETYLDKIYFGEYELLKTKTDTLTKEEYKRRKSIRKEIVSFVNSQRNPLIKNKPIKKRDLTDYAIEHFVPDILEVLKDSDKDELSVLASGLNLKHEKLEKLQKSCLRFMLNWQDPNGKYKRYVWNVLTEGESMVLYFYINNKNKIIEYQEDWTEIEL